MMKHYDKTTTIAVNEWRNALQTCSTQQLLPLVYIVNEVLQTSKRNRGNNFLEAFSPVLGSSMRYICERDKSIVEKVRRILKIWGDRRVFSGRFVGELLRNLETLRGTATDSSRPKTGGGEPPQSSSAAHQPTFSNINSGRTSSVVSGENSDMDNDQDDDNDGLSSPFANSGQSLLQVNVNMNKTTPISRKRPLPDQGNEGKLQDSAKKQQKSKQARKNIKSPTQPQRVKVYSTSTLLDLLKRTEDLSTDFQSAKGILAGTPSSHFSTDPDTVAELVGDELVKMHDDVRKSTKLLNSQRRKVHAIAKERKILEIDAVKFIPFLKDSLKQDDEELLLCDKLEAKIKKLAVVISKYRNCFYLLISFPSLSLILLCLNTLIYNRGCKIHKGQKERGRRVHEKED